MKQKGFSVVELLIVLTVFGAVIVAVATVSPVIANKSKLNRVANELVSNLNLAKQMASMENCYVAVDFSDDGKSYTIRKQADVTSFDADPTNLQNEASWEKVKVVRPLYGDRFFQSNEVKDFAFSPTGSVRIFDLSNTEPTRVELLVYIKKKQSAGDIDLSKKIKIYPYGGISVEE